MDLDERLLFDLDAFPLETAELRLQELKGPVWTKNKALLIQRYVRYFTYITKHGTYIDGFAGPQDADHPDSWAAKLVLEQQPLWLRHFALFERDPKKIVRLRELVDGFQNKKLDLQCFEGDVNTNLPDYLKRNPIKDKEATFCLLDQHTFECDWSTVEFLAAHKAGGHKIEQFYFLAQKWIDRAESGMKIEKEERLERWWGRTDWDVLFKKPGPERGRFLANRFKQELGYKYAHPFAIYEKPASEGHGSVMFYMIHASDHPEAGRLMMRAYNKAVTPLETVEQMEMDFADFC